MVVFSSLHDKELFEFRFSAKFANRFLRNKLDLEHEKSFVDRLTVR